ncbi:MAG: 50S ribosomal protein L32 [Gammaproteobacteria bacterium]|nr:50S ribosomal protein L32 [Gammaproteobacteria bacterium]
MAVQQNRKTRAKRDMRRSHDKIKPATLSIDSTTGTKHRRHHISSDGFYRGEEVIVEKIHEEEEEEKE